MDEAANSQTKFNAAAEDFKLGLGNFIADSGLLDSLYDFGGALLDNITIAKQQSDVLKDQQAEFTALTGALIEVTDNEEIRSQLISEIQTKYPNFIKNIDLESASTEDLKANLDQVNAALSRKIILQVDRDWETWFESLISIVT